MLSRIEKAPIYKINEKIFPKKNQRITIIKLPKKERKTNKHFSKVISCLALCVFLNNSYRK